MTPDQQARLAPGHDRYRQPVDTWELVAMPASGSLRSTANDLLRFLAATFDEHSPLHKAMALMRTPGRALGRRDLHVLPSARNRFYDNTSDAEVSVVPGVDGRVTGLELRAGGSRRTGTRDGGRPK